MPWHSVGNQGLTHRLGDRQECTTHYGICEHVPDFHDIEGDEAREAEGDDGHDRLERHDELAPVDPVAKHAAKGTDDHSGQGANAAYSDDQECRALRTLSEITDQPTQGQELKPVSGVREEVSYPDEPIIAISDPSVERLGSRYPS